MTSIEVDPAASSVTDNKFHISIIDSSGTYYSDFFESRSERPVSPPDTVVRIVLQTLPGVVEQADLSVKSVQKSPFSGLKLPFSSSNKPNLMQFTFKKGHLHYILLTLLP